MVDHGYNATFQAEALKDTHVAILLHDAHHVAHVTWRRIGEDGHKEGHVVDGFEVVANGRNAVCTAVCTAALER